MSNPTNAILQDAFDLIEQNKLEEAQELLKPLLDTDTSNPAVWWVYAHAVDDPEQGVQALDKVLQLDPTYPGASELKTKITTTTTPVAESQPNVDYDAIDDFDDMTFDPDDELSPSSSSGRSPIRFLLIALVFIIAVVAIFGLLTTLLGGSPAEPTEVAEQPTDVPTVDVQIVTNVSATEATNATEVSPTDESVESTTEPTVETVPTEAEETPTEVASATEAEPTDEPTEVIPTEAPTTEPTEEASYASQLVENLADYNIAESDIQTRTTLLGNTVDVTVCALPGAESSLALNGVMDGLVEQVSNIPADITAIAVTVVDCASEDAIPRTIGVPMSAVQSFASNEIALKDFQREWQPLP